PASTGTWEITGMAGFVTDAIANRSDIVSAIMLFDDEDPGSNVGGNWDSSEHTTEANRWKLVVEWVASLPHIRGRSMAHLIVR
ncbi:hypothetical protein LCGC14_0581880, partial [marine sediment metagenome]